MVVQHGDRTLSPGFFSILLRANSQSAVRVVSPSKRHDDGFDIDQDTGRPSGATMDVCRNIISWRRTKRTLRPAQHVCIFNIKTPFLVQLIGLAAKGAANDLLTKQLSAERANSQNMRHRIGIPSLGEH